MTDQDRVNKLVKQVVNVKSEKIVTLASVKVRINQNISKATRKQLKDMTEFSRVLSFCVNQNEVIDLHAYNKQSMNSAIDALVSMHLCKSNEHAIARVRRHKANDITSFIETRLQRLFERASAQLVNVTIAE